MAAAPAEPVYDRKRFRRLFAAVMLPMFLAAVDQTLLATATPVIGSELGDLRDTAWLAVAYLLASTLLAEQVFSVPGLGMLLDSAVVFKDVPVVQALTLLMAAAIALTALLADVAYLTLDPRIRHEMAAR